MFLGFGSFIKLIKLNLEKGKECSFLQRFINNFYSVLVFWLFGRGHVIVFLSIKTMWKGLLIKVLNNLDLPLQPWLILEKGKFYCQKEQQLLSHTESVKYHFLSNSGLIFQGFFHCFLDHNFLLSLTFSRKC